MSEQKVYVGNGKQIDTQYGKLLKLSFSRADLVVLTNHLNEKGYVNINCNERKSVSEWGHTHSMQIDDWQPNQNGQQQGHQPQQNNQGQQVAPQQQNNQNNGQQSNYNPNYDNANQGQQQAAPANNFDDFDSDIPF
jgi:hypothetical protein